MNNNIAIIAHDKMKPLMFEFIQSKQDWFWGRSIIATGQTGDYLADKDLKIKIENLSAGKDGGYRQLKEKVDKDEVALVFFFRDPDLEQDYEDEVSQFLNSCNSKNIPLSTNPASAELLLLGLIKKETSEKLRERAL